MVSGSTKKTISNLASLLILGILAVGTLVGVGYLGKWAYDTLSETRHEGTLVLSNQEFCEFVTLMESDDITYSEYEVEACGEMLSVDYFFRSPNKLKDFTPKGSSLWAFPLILPILAGGLTLAFVTLFSGVKYSDKGE